MKVSDLVRMLSGLDQDLAVDICMRSEYPHSINAERVLTDYVRRCVVIEADDD